MLASFEFLQQLNANRHPDDPTYPAVFIKTPANQKHPVVGHWDGSAPATLNVYMPKFSDAGLPFPMPRVLSRVHVEGGIPALLIRHQFPGFAHVLFLPLLTASARQFLESTRGAGSVMRMLFDAEHSERSHATTFLIGPGTLEEALSRCLNLQSPEDIKAALKPLWAFAKRVHPNTQKEITSMQHVLELISGN